MSHWKQPAGCQRGRKDRELVALLRGAVASLHVELAYRVVASKLRTLLCTKMRKRGADVEGILVWALSSN